MATTQETIEKKSCWSNFVLWKKWGFNELQKFVYILKEILAFVICTMDKIADVR